MARPKELHRRCHGMRIVPRIPWGRCNLHQQAVGAKEDPIALPPMSSRVLQTFRGPLRLMLISLGTQSV